MVCVFDFCFCECCFTVCTPVYGFKPFVYIAFFIHFSEDSNLFGFKFGGNRDVRMFPISPYTKTFEVVFLSDEIFLCKFTAESSQLDRGNRLPSAFEIFHNSIFNGQSVGIVSRDIWCIKS